MSRLTLQTPVCGMKVTNIILTKRLIESISRKSSWHLLIQPMLERSRPWAWRRSRTIELALTVSFGLVYARVLHIYQHLLRSFSLPRTTSTIRCRLRLEYRSWSRIAVQYACKSNACHTGDSSQRKDVECSRR